MSTRTHRVLLAALGLVACSHRDHEGPDARGACEVPAVALTHGTGAPQLARIHKLAPATHPLAVCNDGSPAYYILRPGLGPAATRWVIYLEGGGSCGTGAECLARATDSPSLMSSSGVTDGAAFSGDLAGFKSPSASENPDFFDASFVQIHYCSSDWWTGDRAAIADAPPDSMARWHFRGRAIASAVIADLTARGLASATEVLLIGTSAGGMGVANLVDDLRPQLPAAARVLAAQDAGFALDYPPYDPVTQTESTASPSSVERAVMDATVAWGGRGDAACDAAATDELGRARCYIPSRTFSSGAVDGTMFVRQSQQDPVQLKQLGAKPTDAGPVAAYRGRFAAAMRAALAGLDARFTVFSTDDALHGVINTTEGWTSLSIDGVSVRDAFGAWYRDPCAGGGKRIAP